MPRYHNIDGEKVQFTSEEETARDAEEAAAVKEKEDYAKIKYRDDRKIAYGDIGDQLDLLFHDMTAGKGTKDGEWYKAVAKVKSDHPKPE